MSMSIFYIKIFKKKPTEWQDWNLPKSVHTELNVLRLGCLKLKEIIDPYKMHRPKQCFKSKITTSITSPLSQPTFAFFYKMAELEQRTSDALPHAIPPQFGISIFFWYEITLRKEPHVTHSVEEISQGIHFSLAGIFC